MARNCHYYILSLGMEKSVLFEAFRDHLVDIRNQGFPVMRRPGAVAAGALPDLAREIDGCLAHHHAADPLDVVVVGDRALRSAFAAVTVHGPSVVGEIPGDHTATSPRDLGQIVWPVIKAAMSMEAELALQNLAAATPADLAVRGLEAVAGHLREGSCGTLLVEEDFHVRGSLYRTGHAPAISPALDIRDVLDNAVDAVIERALASGGRVVFTPDGSLAAWDRIALLPGSGGTT